MYIVQKCTVLLHGSNREKCNNNDGHSVFPHSNVLAVTVG